MRSAAIGVSRNRRASVELRVYPSHKTPAQLQQPEVGIGRRRQPAEDRRQQLLHDARTPREAGRELLQRGARLLDVAEPECAEWTPSAAASGSTPTPASVSSNGAKNSFSWIDRTTL